MIALDNKTGYDKNECWVIVNEKGYIVDYPTFKNNRRHSYYYSNRDSVPNLESQFKTRQEAEAALLKCKRPGSVRKLMFENTDVSSCYNGDGAIILGYDFVNERIWINSKDGTKYGYDYRYIKLIA
jgi:hypothetical protein